MEGTSGMSMLPIEPDHSRHCFSPCMPGTFCRCQGTYIEPWDPDPQEEAPAPPQGPCDPE